jgi:hypothetical protein
VISRRKKVKVPAKLRNTRGPYKLRRDLTSWYKDYGIDLAIIGIVLFTILAKKEKYGITSVNELDRIINNK